MFPMPSINSRTPARVRKLIVDIYAGPDMICARWGRANAQYGKIIKNYFPGISDALIQ
jgi:hypothetical protein